MVRERERCVCTTEGEGNEPQGKTPRCQAQLNKNHEDVEVLMGRVVLGAPHPDLFCEVCDQPAEAWEFEKSPSGLAHGGIRTEGEDESVEPKDFIICHSCFERGDETAEAIVRKARHEIAHDTCEMQCVNENGEPELYIIFNGVRIAKRGHPDTPQARTWISLDPEWSVRDGKRRRKGGEIIIERCAPEAH
jgi:hypothetical protein